MALSRKFRGFYRYARIMEEASEAERRYQAFHASGNLQVFQPQLDELGRLHRQWLSDLDAFKDSLRTQGAEPKVLEYVNEAFSRLAERIKQLCECASVERHQVTHCYAFALLLP